MESTPRFEAVGVVVQDMARSLRLYRALGLDIPAEADTQPHVDVALGGGLRLMFDPVETVRSFDPDWTPPTGGHRVSLAFRCADAAAVDATYARLLELGATSHKAPWDAFWEQRYAMVRDPDGTMIDLFSDR